MASHDSPLDCTESRRPRTRGSDSHRLSENVPLEQRVLASSIPHNRAAHANRLSVAQAHGPDDGCDFTAAHSRFGSSISRLTTMQPQVGGCGAGKAFGKRRMLTKGSRGWSAAAV